MQIGMQKLSHRTDISWAVETVAGFREPSVYKAFGPGPPNLGTIATGVPNQYWQRVPSLDTLTCQLIMASAGKLGLL